MDRTMWGYYLYFRSAIRNGAGPVDGLYMLPNISPLIAHLVSNVGSVNRGEEALPLLLKVNRMDTVASNKYRCVGLNNESVVERDLSPCRIRELVHIDCFQWHQ
jgi:hypothetical protein